MKPKDLLFKHFKNKHVNIVTKLHKEESAQTEDSIQTMKTPIVVEGVLLNKDNKFYYLGTPSPISRAIKISDVSYIELLQEENPLMNVLENMGEPQKEEDFN